MVVKRSGGWRVGHQMQSRRFVVFERTVAGKEKCGVHSFGGNTCSMEIALTRIETNRKSKGGNRRKGKLAFRLCSKLIFLLFCVPVSHSSPKKILVYSQNKKKYVDVFKQQGEHKRAGKKLENGPVSPMYI